MRKKKNGLLFGVLVILLVVTACNTGTQLTALNQKGDDALMSGNTKSAMEAYEESISGYEKAGKNKECPVYTKAAFAAMQLKDTAKALQYLEKAKYTASENEKMWYGLALCYKHIDNLSKEMDALQTYKKKYPDGKNIADINKELFLVYVESENNDKAMKLWPELNAEQKADPEIISEYFTVNKRQNNAAVCDSLTSVLLKQNENSMQALEWKAEKYYDLAENMYKKEMKAYENHKTRKQYAHLLKQLEIVTANYKKSLGYYKKLYKLSPENKYARRLANIYFRLDDKKKADYYRKKING